MKLSKIFDNVLRGMEIISKLALWVFFTACSIAGFLLTRALLAAMEFSLLHQYLGAILAAIIVPFFAWLVLLISRAFSDGI